MNEDALVENMTAEEKQKEELKCKKAIKTLDSILGDLQNQLTPLVSRSKEWQTAIKEAKTSTKQRYFKKKLQKNNHIVMHLLVSMEQHQNLKETYVKRLGEVLDSLDSEEVTNAMD